MKRRRSNRGLVRDTEVVTHHRVMEAAEAYRQALTDSVKEEMRNAVKLEELEQDPTNAATRLGRMMSTEELEKKISKLVPGMVYTVHPGNPTKKVMFLPGTDFSCPYENSTMPEKSVLRKNVKKVLDTSFLDNPAKRIERADLPKYDYVEDAESPFGYSVEFDPEALRPGEKEIVEPYGEATRGWRTVLLHLITQGLCTADAAERVFYITDKDEQWAAHTNQRSDAQALW